MSITINSEYNYILRPDKSINIISDNYAIKYDSNISKNTDILFEKISWDNSKLKSNNLLLGSIYFKGNTLPIDFITKTNKEKLLNISNIWNKPNIDEYPFCLSALDYTLEIDNIYNVIGAFKKEESTYNARDLKYSRIYDSKYAKYIYRAKRKNNIQLVDNIIQKNNIPYQIPVFSFDSNNIDVSQINIYMKLRNIEIPLKIIKTSSHNTKDYGIVASYIAIYPEYLLKTYQEWYDSIMYIKLDKGTIIDNIIYYDYLYEDQTKTILLPDGEKSISKLATLRSNRSFF